MAAVWGLRRSSLRFGRPVLSGCRHKASTQYLSRPDLPKLAYRKLKGKSPGVLYLPGYFSDMHGQKAVALEDFCKSLGHSFVRFDYSGCGSSEGDFKEQTVGRLKKDALSVLDNVCEGPQVKKEIEENGEWKIPSKYAKDGFYKVPYGTIKEAENHCLLASPIPITCPVRLIHGMKDEDISWYISMQVADRVLSTDVDVILRKQGEHRMNEKDDMKLLVYTIDDLIDKLKTAG
ncbi:palmitoyl-protein thioesterase ABHD10, mitochondrial isoform X2 [Microcaecilia unicolor]|uniref:Mycophenolic acid acyl-glucuronide esterase, mitochondrial isoform X2 n=1 Tax=Microcaecilia unicolor TaxID=1415580 RepID=A0A6P7Y561_9AMPH|nr:mycophenolic acid acyl-glucuronide esterase, mitochondrial isoform X2 [Microcaecilia unicolor]